MALNNFRDTSTPTDGLGLRRHLESSVLQKAGGLLQGRCGTELLVGSEQLLQPGVANHRALR
jgi:hypothetical protein